MEEHRQSQTKIKQAETGPIENGNGHLRKQQGGYTAHHQEAEESLNL